MPNKNFSKIKFFTIAILFFCAIASVVALSSDKFFTPPRATLDSIISVQNTNSAAFDAKIQLVPTVTFTSKSGHTILLGNNVEEQSEKVFYSGLNDYKQLTFGWELSTENLPQPTVVCKDKNDNPVDINKIAVAGAYKIIISLNDENYTIAENKNQFYFTISPYSVNVDSLEFVDNIYDRTPKLAKAVISEHFYDNGDIFKIVCRHKINGIWKDYIDGEMPQNSGKYELEIVSLNENYVFEGNAKVERDILPRPLQINYDLPPSLVYDGNDKEIKNITVKGILDGDNVEISCTYLTNGQKTTPNKSGLYYIIFDSDNPNYAPPINSKFTISQQSITVNIIYPEQIIYDGAPKYIKYSCFPKLPQGLEISVLYNGESQLPTDAKNYSIHLSVQGENSEQYSLDWDKSASMDILQRKIGLQFVSPFETVYNGSNQPLKFVLTNIVDSDKTSVSCNLLYNGSTSLPINAASYAITLSPFGDSLPNYIFDFDSKTYIIQKAEYPFKNFAAQVENKILTISTEFGNTLIEYSIDNQNWQRENCFAVNPMLHITIFVKLVEDNNHIEKILAQNFFTGFDKEIFNTMLTNVNLEKFSFKDMALCMEIMRDKELISPNDLENIDKVRLAAIEFKYNELRNLSVATIASAQTAYASIFYDNIASLAFASFGSLGLIIGSIKRKQFCDFVRKHKIAFISAIIVLVLALTLGLGIGLGLSLNSHNYLLKDMQKINYSEFESHSIFLSQNGTAVYEQHNENLTNDFQLDISALQFDNAKQGFALNKKDLRKFKQVSSDGDKYTFVGEIASPSDFAKQNVNKMSIILVATKNSPTNFSLNSIKINYIQNGFNIVLILEK